MGTRRVRFINAMWLLDAPGGGLLGIGFTEILLIGMVVLLVVGPEKLPHLMRTAGRHYGQLRRSADELRRAFVLEADRQDAEARMQALRERRKQQAEARKRALEAAGEGAVAQGEVTEPVEQPDEDPDAPPAVHHADPLAPAAPAAPAASGGDR